MDSKYGFTRMSSSEVNSWLHSQNVSRGIKLIQLHHTWQPSYSTFFNNGNDSFYLQKNMKDYHVNTNGWSDIAQHFSVFPDGSILTGRSLNSTPAGIVGGNTGAICIENVGNFDKGQDTMSDVQKNAILSLVRGLMLKFSLSTDSIRYHCWYTAGGTYLGDYSSSRSAKTCPGTNFFGGNTKSAFNNNLAPLLRGEIREEDEPMTESERQNFEKLSREVSEVKETLNTLISGVSQLREIVNNHIKNTHFTFDYVDDNMPDWAKPIVLKGIEVGMIHGVENNPDGSIKRLGLTIQDIKALAFDLREKGYNV